MLQYNVFVVKASVEQRNCRCQSGCLLWDRAEIVSFSDWLPFSLSCVCKTWGGERGERGKKKRKQNSQHAVAGGNN